MKRLLLPALLLLPAGGAAVAAGPPQRTAAVTVYGDDPCPKSTDDEIVVCARKPERERYRIPKELRHENEDLSEQSWGARTEALEEANRATMPGGCSTVGSYGQTGCRQQMLRQWYAERRARSGRTGP
ncbi:MAG: hypothetical protein QOE79_667 [Sphingomonadales bacterium]|jgi:hypothetical protein|nr:hypothetical protein [Sphingomonadales bacterium]MEA3049429.1 hypothetical protein [Sphingomonadales bacterium]